MDTFVAWTAGFLDGEGSVYFVKPQTDRRRRDGDGAGSRRRVGVTISQADRNNGRAVLGRLRDEWGFGSVAERRTTSVLGKHWIWSWEVAAWREVEHLLRCVEPYSLVKHERIVEALAYIDSNRPSRYTWSNGEDAVLRLNAGSTDADIARLLDRSEDAVRHRRKKLGLAPSVVRRDARYLGS